VVAAETLLAVLVGVARMVSLRGGAMLAKQRTHPWCGLAMAEAEETACRARRRCRRTWRGGFMFMLPVVPRGVGCTWACGRRKAWRGEACLGQEAGRAPL